MQFTVTLGKRLLFLLFTFIICYLIISVLMGVIIATGHSTTSYMRILIILQDILLFVTPALATACIITRTPANLLAVTVRPNLTFLAIAVFTLVFSYPAMDVVIWLNQNAPLPDSLRETLIAMENAAEASTQLVLGSHTVINLIMSLLIVGVLAGFSEELLFRGALQRILSTGGVNIHAAIWTAAFIFSAMHMQILGFIPRMLLGAFFGYALYWSKSLWIPIILHILNNSIYLINDWMLYPDKQEIENPLSDTSGCILAIASFIATVFGLYILWKYSARLKKNLEKEEISMKMQ